ncbi:MAG: hypothetical protein AB7O96_02965 [Pseudobdellovibrionaceae bacterium]
MFNFWFRNLLVAATALFVGYSAGANTPAIEITNAVISMQQDAAFSDVETMALNWKIGDSLSYKIAIGFFKGTAVVSVKEEVTEGFWLNQAIEISNQKMDAQMLIDKNTGRTLKLIVNGKEETPPDPNDIELIDMKEDRITVTAGTFDCIHIRARNKKDKKEINQWANPRDLPVTGVLKSIAPSQFGNVTMELTSFRKN